jgi:hypothetical protein
MFRIGYRGCVGIGETDSSPFARYINDFDLINTTPYSVITRFKILVNHSIVPPRMIAIKMMAKINPNRCSDIV